jgi:uncharacterized protein YndB with AHSA1/START domain
MATAATRLTAHEEQDLVLEITRVFGAPRTLVFKAFTDPVHATKWMGPREFPAHHVEADVRPGGKWRIGLRASDAITDHRRGAEIWQGGVYKEVVPPERLAWTSRWDAEPWNENSANNPETLVTVVLAELGPAKTRMVFRQAVFDTKSNRDGHVGGWSSAFDRLVEHLKEAT